MARRRLVAAVLVVTCAGWLAWSGSPATAVRAPGAHHRAAACGTTVVAAGDMNAQRPSVATGALAQSLHPDVVTVLGDQVYPDGSLAGYRSKYAKTGWGALRSITRPVPGNHEYRTPGAAGYYDYFGYPPPYYAYDAGCGWRAYALNSEIGIASQAAWLCSDLAAHPTALVLAYWHRPRWSSGSHHGSDPAIQPFLTCLTARYGLVLNAHEHQYERFAPISGLREFVVGTAGSASYPFALRLAPGSVVRIGATPGLLLLRLTAGGYTWSFRNVHDVVLDSGAG